MSIGRYLGWIDSLSRDVHKCNKLFLDSYEEGILSIAPLELFRRTQIALHCPCHESSSLILHTMGCRHYFVPDRLKALVDEGDSRSSSRVREHGSFRLVSQLHVAIQTLWSRRLFPHVVWTNRWIVHFQRVAPFYHDLRLRFRLRLWSLSKRSTDTLVLSQPSKKRLSISWTLERDGGSVVTSRPVLTIGLGVFGWVCWELSSCPATSEPNSFIQLTSKEIFEGGRGHAYTLSYMISPVSILIAFGTQ